MDRKKNYMNIEHVRDILNLAKNQDKLSNRKKNIQTNNQTNKQQQAETKRK